MDTKQLIEIYDGWKNYVFLNPEVEAEAKRRIEICVECVNFKKNKSCAICGCYMPAKVRSPKSKCSIEKW
jgi:hypothetical protein